MKRPAFTLIEIMVSILIIGLITTVAAVSVGQVRAKSRDTKRITDIKSLQSALEAYYRDENQYPAALVAGSPLVGSTSSTTYLAAVPTPPEILDGSCTSSDYIYQTSENNGYGIEFCLGQPANDAISGLNCARPKGIVSGPCLSCGDNINYAGVIYPTTLIGNQCWLAKNLNIGAIITGTANPTDNGIIEKYCYNDLVANCTAYGGLYQWNETMQYSTTEAAQGICPAGWHVPTDAEQSTLENYLKDSGQACGANRIGWECYNAGTKLLLGGDSHFEGLLNGYRDTNASFTGHGTDGYFWSSSINDSSAWLRLLYAGNSAVGRVSNPQTLSFSVRCLKN
ncbi:MAG TPA: FISUMP domain-containing protein [bacterium]|nr:FISUMP domain-containing protein [bacterium]HPT29725.1 FISUMP domain-containing protein [bacterium]